MKSLSNLLSRCLGTAVLRVSRAVQRGEEIGWMCGRGTERVDVWESLHIIFIPRTLHPKASCLFIACHVSDCTMIHECKWDKKRISNEKLNWYALQTGLVPSPFFFKQGSSDRGIFRGTELSKTCFFFLVFPFNLSIIEHLTVLSLYQTLQHQVVELLVSNDMAKTEDWPHSLTYGPVSSHNCSSQHRYEQQQLG